MLSIEVTLNGETAAKVFDLNPGQVNRFRNEFRASDQMREGIPDSEVAMEIAELLGRYLESIADQGRRAIGAKSAGRGAIGEWKDEQGQA
jgi:hypothetical protein